MAVEFKNLNDIIAHTNLAEMVDEESLARMGEQVVHDYDLDKGSREEWERRNEKWMELASQVLEQKNFPWVDSSNVKYPLLTTSSMQFHARAHQSLVSGDNPVKVRPFGQDPDGQKRKRAGRLSRFMSHQILHQMTGWEEDMDRLLLILPVIGLCFKKIYYSPTQRQNVSELVLPKDLVINYHATSFKKARKTQVLYKDGNEVEELKRKGIYLDHVDLGKPTPVEHTSTEDLITGQSPPGETTEDTHTILEQHTLWDLNDDGHKEPYIITVDRDTKQVLRITARFNPDGVEYTEGGKVAGVEPIEYFVRYVFLPDLNSPIYGLGFGAILGPLNSAVNTLTNQLVDSGTLANMPVGFLGRGIRLARGGTTRFKPGEWKVIHSTGDDLRKGVFPLPVKEPSSTLFQLLGLLVQSGEKVGSIADIMLGENPGQNQPYSTTSAVLEQGLKVFVGIYKRVYRSLTQEYRRLYDLNNKHLDPEQYAQFLDDPEADFETDFGLEGFDVLPASDPNVVTEAQKLIKAEALLQKLAMGLPLNVQDVTRRILEAEGHEDIQQLMEVPPPQPDPELMLKAQEHQDKMQLEAARLKLDASTKEFEALKDQAQAILNFAKAQAESLQNPEAELQLEYAKAQLDMINKVQDQELKRQSQVDDLMAKREEMRLKQQSSELDAMNQAAKGAMDLEQQKAKNELELEKQRQQAAASNNNNSAPK